MIEGNVVVNSIGSKIHKSCFCGLSLTVKICKNKFQAKISSYTVLNTQCTGTAKMDWYSDKQLG